MLQFVPYTLLTITAMIFALWLRAEYRAYLTAVEAADEKPSPVTRLLERL